MPKASSGYIPGDIPTNSKSGSDVKILSEDKPRGAVVQALTDYKIQAVSLFPELEGKIYSTLNKLREGTFNKQNVLGIYDEANKKIVIAKHIYNDNALLRKTASHELAHVLTERIRRGFRSAPAAFNRAFREYRQTSPSNWRKFCQVNF